MIMLSVHITVAWTILGLAITGTATDAPAVETRLGKIVGTTKEVDVFGKKMTVDRFHGIPYAEPPVGDLRFKKPVPKESLPSPFQATKHGSICYQINTFPSMENLTRSEDCLFLNIYAPSERKKPLAVMIWIHGGGFMSGASDLTIADTLASYGDVIIVTINYRLTMWGFLSTGDANAPGNIAFWDQHFAIKWVHDNIHAFGGDPDRVTLFGESAGGMSVTYQSFYGGNKDLFQRVIAQSGTLWASAAKDPIKDAKRLGELVGCEQTESGSLVLCLQGISAETLERTINNFTNGLFGIPFPFSPSIDGEFLSEHPRDLLLSENAGSSVFSGVDFMSGICAEEGAALMHIHSGTGDLENFKPNRTTLRQSIPLAISAVHNTAETIPDVLTEVVAHEYTDWSEPDNMETIRSKLIQILSDIMLSAPMIHVLSKHNALADSARNTYMYVFEDGPTPNVLPTPTWFKNATHGDELMFLFFEEDLGAVRYLPGHENHQIQDWYRDVAKAIMTLWSNFAKTGNPNKPKSVDIDWPAYTQDKPQYVKLSRTMTSESIQTNLIPSEANLWNKIVPSLWDAIRKGSDTESPGYCEKDGDCSP